MAKLLNLFILISVFSVPLFSEAFSFFIPQGQREALMGNVGIALNSSEGAVLYNPAGAAGLDSARISASGSLLNASTFEVEYKGSFNDRNATPSFFQIPGLIAGYSQTSWGNVGFFINTDYLVNFEKLITYETSQYRLYTDIINNFNSLNLGLVIANLASVSDSLKLQYGFTLNLNMLESNSNSFTKTYTTYNNVYRASFSTKTVKTTNLVGRLGILAQGSDYSLGGYIQPKGTRISTSYSNFAYEVDTAGTVTDNSTNTGSPLYTPTNYGVGIGLQPSKHLRLYLDMNVSEAAADEGAETDGPGNSRVDFLGLGGEYTLAAGNHIYAGLSNSITKSENGLNTWLLSSGFDYKISFIKNYFGAYYSLTRSLNEAEANRNKSSFSYFGIIIASQYAF